jgi:1-acyl-sn-glycerol-3-phosphate acyltransferase
MIGGLRLVLGLALVALSTLVVAPSQWLALKTGLWPDTIIPKLWHRSIVKAAGFHIHVTGALSQKRPLLVASNHISWTDIAVLGSLADVNFIARGDMAGWPLMGWLATLQRTVFVERERKRTSGEQANEIASRLARGDAMVLFAEGTTGDGNMVLPFKSTLFGAASMTIAEGGAEEVFIQPVAIAYTRLHGMPLGRTHRPLAAWIGDEALWPHAKRLLARGGIDVEVRFGEPVPFRAGFNRKETARRIEREVHDMMQAALRNPAPVK